MKPLIKQLSATCLCFLLINSSFVHGRHVDHGTISDNQLSAALISSASALGGIRHRPQSSSSASASSSIADMALASLAAPVAAAAAEVASSVLASATGSSSPALTASSGGSSLALPPLPTLISIIQSAALTASSAMQAATPSRLSATAPGLSDRRRTMRLIARDAMTYLAAPLFMPTAFRRALQQPNGLPQDQAPIRRLGRFLIRRFRPQSQTTELNDNFADLLTKNRKNILLTMKQFRELTKHTSAITHKKRA